MGGGHPPRGGGAHTFAGRSRGGGHGFNLTSSTPAQLAGIIAGLALRDTPVPADGLATLRKRIDTLDNRLLDILARRMEVSREIGRYKRSHKMPVVQPARYGDVVQTRICAGRKLGLSDEFMRTLLSAIHEESVRQQVDGQD